MVRRLPVRVPPPPKEERPECLQCGHRLRPWMWGIYERVDTVTGYWNKEVATEWRGDYHGVRSTFCSTKCAAAFGCQVARVFIDGAESVRLSPKSATRLPGIRDAHAREVNMRVARDVLSTESSDG